MWDSDWSTQCFVFWTSFKDLRLPIVCITDSGISTSWERALIVVFEKIWNVGTVICNNV